MPFYPFANETQAVLAVAGPVLAFTRQQWQFVRRLVFAQ
jgi:hypothetical protein